MSLSLVMRAIHRIKKSLTYYSFVGDASIDKVRMGTDLCKLVGYVYVNSEGVWTQNCSSYICGVQELGGRVEFNLSILEIYRRLYSFNLLVVKEEFLHLYYFGDLGR